MLLQATGISKRYGKEAVLLDLQFSLGAHEVLSVLGRSGSGKTTMLKILAGLETPDAGVVRLDGQVINQTPPNRRGIVYLYQEALLFPHLDVFENVAFGLRLQRIPDREIRTRVDEMLVELELSDQARKRPEQLSGGQRQRVSFGRALIINPRVLLLDEPFGALDTETRLTMQQFFLRIARRHRITAVFVTHDLREALLMGDRIGLMENGRLNIYPDKAAFIADAKTGVQREIEFWNKIIK